MPRSARQSPALFSDLIILVVVVFTAAMAMLSPGFALGSSRAFEFYAALAAYAFLAILAVPRLFSGDEWWRDCAYFGLQLALFGVLVALRVDAIWLLSMPVVSQASLRLRVPALVAVTVAYLVMFCILFPSESWTWSSRVSSLLSLGAAYAFVIAMTRGAGWAKRAQERAEKLAAELEEANVRLRAAAAQTAELAAAHEGLQSLQARPAGVGG